ncbi:iron-sulfur cluster assembly 1 homolog, mitochondrial isoform X18 [Canis lupus familiaris]|uniref:iron-sulfur cluster assembly 1 homolog, mitochondrial isoform X15 n=1 Tax=Canis lupus familiaris TaxID=9615 RepID=UPI0018F421A5|nr:iron-sulfur cluster assembly 1 homolog, mitochondrial isoform X15 [Canis lupus familiaris]XP_038425309.1 iron-sulfur cluster assembly 1 homolog, mitochondrial isoform X18 [Canis lupus familiaris]XP_048972006.1 iron-sulfur cluster assembly 1 homolog, mitochondrial isoform X1 [Canis lupus dingo]
MQPHSLTFVSKEVGQKRFKVKCCCRHQANQNQAEIFPGVYTRDTNPNEEDEVAESPRWSLPEFYALVEHFRKKSNKLKLLKTHRMSLSEAQEMLSQNLSAMSFSSGTNVREEVFQPIFMCKVVRKEKEEPDSMTEVLYRSLLTSSLSPVERLSRSQQRLFQCGIPPPTHTFPYEILIDHSKSLSPVPIPIEEKTQSANILHVLGISRIRPQNFIFGDKIAKYFLVNPEKQFMDLRDLEWRYYKGIVKWKHSALDSFIDIKHDDEKRFVESREMPGVICPPILHGSLVIYPQVDYQKKM